MLSKYRHLILLLLVVLFAYGYRIVIIIERAIAPDNAGAFNPLPEGSDQVYYYWSVHGFREGTFPPRTFYFQPGISYFLIALSYLLNTTDIAVLRLAIALLASINCGIMYILTQLAFGKEQVSLIAAFLLAVYPVGAFYDTDFVITSQGTLLLTLALVGALWIYRYPHQFAGAVLIGLAAGAGLTMRPEVAITSSLIMLWVLVTRIRQKHNWLLPFLCFAIVAVLIPMPIFIHNQRGGSEHLIGASSGAAIYNGLNRDASGTGTGFRADFTTRYDYFRFLLLDIQLEPMRFMELLLRKIGLLFSATEPGNNLDYANVGQKVSIALRLNPLDFRILFALSVFGGVALWQARQSAYLLFVIAVFVMFATIMLLYVEARIRTPVIAALVPLAAYGLNDLWHSIQQRKLHRLKILTALTLVAWFAVAWLLENHLPRKLMVQTLPEKAHAIDVIYNQELRLLAYDIQDQYTPRGRFEPFRPYVVTLYWLLEKPTEINYSFSLKFEVDGEGIDSFDHPIGFVSYPHVPTSQWEVGKIYVEHIGMSVRRFDVPTETSGHLWLDVYPDRNAMLLFDPVGSGRRPLTLAHPAIMWDEGGFLSLSEQRDACGEIQFDTLLILEACRVPSEGQRSETTTIEFGWRSTDVQIQESYIIGVYLQDQSGEFVANFDAPFRNGRLFTHALPPNYRLEDKRTVTLPDKAGVYKVYVGVYSYLTGERLTLQGQNETLALIGMIHVR